MGVTMDPTAFLSLYYYAFDSAHSLYGLVRFSNEEWDWLGKKYQGKPETELGEGNMFSPINGRVGRVVARRAVGSVKTWPVAVTSHVPQK